MDGSSHSVVTMDEDDDDVDDVEINGVDDVEISSQHVLRHSFMFVSQSTQLATAICLQSSSEAVSVNSWQD